LAEDEAEAFVVGGAAIYRLALPLADRLYLTRVHANIPGDVEFPDWRPEDWRLAWEEPHEADDRHAYAFTFQQYDRVAGGRT